jgi:hypothetical protein
MVWSRQQLEPEFLGGWLAIKGFRYRNWYTVPDFVRIAFRALHTDDRELKGTALEYLASATPPDTRQLLLPLLEADGRLRSADAEHGVRDPLASNAQINTNPNLQPAAMEARR